MEVWIETSLASLYKSAVEAFPTTTKRQFSTHTVKVEKIQWLPFEGLKTLFVKGLLSNEGKKNDCVILFKQVAYRDSEGRGIVPVAASDGRKIWIERLSLGGTDALVRCSCGDFRWRFSHWNGVDKSLYGRGPRKYEALARPGSSNPSESPGLCKHLMKMAKILRESGVLGI